MTIESPMTFRAPSPLSAPNAETLKSVHSVQIRQADGNMLAINEQMLAALLRNLSSDLKNIEVEKIAEKAMNGIHEGSTEEELNAWLIQTVAMLISEEPEYSRLASRLLSQLINGELSSLGLETFSDSIRYGHQVGIISEDVLNFVLKHRDTLDRTIKHERTDLFEYFGLRTVYDRYLLKDPVTRKVIENPQNFFMRVACGLAQTPEEALEFYNLISSFEYMPSTPTLFNSGTGHPQMSSCYLLDSPQDSLEAIYGKYTDIALLSKFAGGIGVGFSRVRSRGSLIRGTNGKSNGIVPFLKTLDSSVSAVNQGGKRKGAACVYLETWHADILDFLSLRDNTGDEAMRTHNLNLANWIPDLFMERVESGQDWSLFDPSDVPSLPDLFGKEFNAAYLKAEADGLAKSKIPARDLYGMMMKTLAQTGNGWMTFKDASNLKGNQTLRPGNTIHLANLCTEILEVSSDKETAVCNLGSVNLSRYVNDQGQFDFERLGKNVKTALKYLDRVVDINFYPIGSAKNSNHKWRPVGLGAMGLQNVFFKMRLPFDSKEALELSTRIQEEIYLNALDASCSLAEEFGPHGGYEDTRMAQGQLQFDLWGVTPSQTERWDALRQRIKKHGVRNSLMIAIAPTATIASITGAYECIEPQLSNLFKRETLSGEFLQVNPFLVKDLRDRGLWNQEIRNKIKLGEGSVQQIEEIPEDLRLLYRTVWELPQRALIDMAADRGPYIDQSQSLNLFMESPNLGKVSSMYAYAWKKGLKTCYYFRSRGATRINKATVSPISDRQAISCSLENPEACESCT